MCKENNGFNNRITGNSAARKKGLRCQICTGCGLCPGITPEGSMAGGLRVLAEDAVLGMRLPIKGARRLAVADVGTTTVAMLLYAGDGSVEERFVAVNPQTGYGADVISRIRAAEDRNAAKDMQDQILQVLGQGLARFQGRLKEGEELFLVLAANTTMTYLLMGWDPAELGHAPFQATRLDSVETKVCGVPCFVFPGLSAFVGGDIVAGIYACGMCEKGLTLLLDLGTNGEIVLGNSEKRIACATAAGPAFEGGVNRGIWGADMISLLARLRREGILDETGLLAEPYFADGIRIGNVRVTKEAVRSVQLAKGAIAAGIETLLKRFGADAKEIERVVLAGGFGYYLQPGAAADIGLFPKGLAERTVTGGNTALSGALMAGRYILSGGTCQSFDKLLKGTVLRTEVLNLAEDPGFEQRYLSRLTLDCFSETD